VTSRRWIFRQENAAALIEAERVLANLDGIEFIYFTEKGRRAP